MYAFQVLWYLHVFTLANRFFVSPGKDVVVVPRMEFQGRRSIVAGALNSNLE